MIILRDFQIAGHTHVMFAVRKVYPTRIGIIHPNSPQTRYLKIEKIC
ncbi:unnamed protein product [Rhodiola kirilowii]